MKRQLTTSKHLISIGYDAELQMLEIEFYDNSVYQFVRVTSEVYVALMEATDKYEYYIAHIMDEFAGQRVYP